MGIRHSIVIVLLFTYFAVDANTYAVYLKDKNGSSFSVLHPEEFLSVSAIARRQRQHIPIAEIDLPVSATYQNILKQYAVQIHYSSKWLNCVVLESTPFEVQKIKQLSFVSAIHELNNTIQPSYKTNSKFETLTPNAISDFDADKYYASSTVQNKMIHVDFLHKRGFKGDGVIVGHFDNGCANAKNIAGFDSLFSTSRFIGSRDIVDADDNVFNDGTHGTSTLSCLAANTSGKMVGTSPNASFYLLRTENNSSETIQEEYNWVYGAEVADSIGAELFTTSLGYTTFDNNIGNHSYADINGNKTPITVAANIASRLGILVINSAGNEGDAPWHYIAAPADGDSVLAIGAVNGERKHAKFSSFGPNFSGKVKPDVCAMGAGTSVFDQFGNIYASNGTSFSGPVMAGGIVCLRQAYPTVSNLIILDAVRKSAHLFKHPNDSLGYGIPDLAVAFFLLDDYVKRFSENQEHKDVFPNPFRNEVNVFVQQPTETELNVELYDFSGHLVLTQRIHLENNQSQYITLNTENLNSGAYLLRIRGTKFYDVQRVEKL
jgi:hypothetical protein